PHTCAEKRFASLSRVRRWRSVSGVTAQSLHPIPHGTTSAEQQVLEALADHTSAVGSVWAAGAIAPGKWSTRFHFRTSPTRRPSRTTGSTAVTWALLFRAGASG